MGKGWKMLKYRLIATDLDGTLLDSGGQIPDYAKEAVGEYHRLGGLFTIATGRMDGTAGRFAKELNVRIPIVTYNGGKVIDLNSGRVLSEAFLNCEKAVEAYKALKRLNKDMVVYFGGLPYVSGITDTILKYKKRINFEVYLIEDVHKVIVPETKKILVIDPKGEFDLMKSIISKVFGNSLNCVVSDEEYFEILPVGVSKGRGLQTIADSLGIPMEEVIAIGDYYNDISMIRAAGLGIAVRNAKAEVLAAADYITSSNDENGVAQVVRKVISKVL